MNHHRYADWAWGATAALGIMGAFWCASGWVRPSGSARVVPGDRDMPWWFWALALLLALVAARWWYLSWAVRHRPRMGCCGKCGYDLTGNVSGRCPECGTEVPNGHHDAPR